MADIRFKVQQYIDDGHVVLPVNPGEKATRFKSWSEPGVKPALSDFGENDNVAERLDGNLVDIDCDCPETRRVARTMLLYTERVHARPSLVDEGATHYWYRVEGEPKSFQFKDTDGSVLIEIRNGVGQYSLIPPSVVLTKSEPAIPETLIWEREGDASTVVFEDLKRSATMVATSALLGRHWPAGSRHVAARDASGFLAARGFDEREVVEMIKSAALLAGDSEVEDRIRAARDSVKNFAAGHPTTGLPMLEAAIGKDVVAVLKKWHGGANGAIDEVIEEMNERHFYARVGKDTIVGTLDLEEVVLQNEKALYSWYANQHVILGEHEISRGPKKGQTEIEKVSKFELWRSHEKRRQYRAVNFAPPPYDKKIPSNDFNLWTGFSVNPDPNPAPEERCRRYLGLVRDVICGGEPEKSALHSEYLLDLMAITVQEPGLPCEIAVVLCGERGTGKGQFIRNFGSLFGRHYVQIAKAEQITGKFNSSCSGKVVIFADEAFWAGDKSSLGALKVMITEPTLRIERKGIDAITEPNFIHLYMASNEDWHTPAGFHERRFFVLKVSDERRQDYDYFAEIVEEMENGGREALLAFLLARPITKERRKQLREAPRTAELGKQVEATMSYEMRWFKEKLVDGEISEIDGWPEEVSVKMLHEDYLSWCDKMKINRRVAIVQFARDVIGPWLGESKRGARTEGQNGRSRLRALLPLEDARAKFDEVSGIGNTWEGDAAPGDRLPEMPF